MKRSRLKVRDAMTVLEGNAPLATQEEWDNGGLLLGDPEEEVKGVLVSTDLTGSLVRELRKSKGNLLVLHHPPIFPKARGISRLTKTGNQEELSDLLWTCARRGIGVLVSHTSFDRCAHEPANAISTALGVELRGKLSDPSPLLKLRVFVPKKNLDSVRNALADAGAGHIGNYDSCSFSSEGVGTFRGLEGSKPRQGNAGRLEKVPEFALETIFPKGLQSQVVEAMRQAHPYEEPAFDLIPLAQKSSKLGFSKGLGYGFWAESKKARPLSDWLTRIRSAFRTPSVRVTSMADAKRAVKRIAFSPGKGSALIQSVVGLGCEAFLTGELDYHESVGFARAGGSVWEIGHTESERYTVLTLAGWLKNAGFRAETRFSQLQRVDTKD